MWSEITDRLESGLQALPRPTNYYIGRRHGGPGMPENILLFLRRNLSVTPQAHHHHRHVLILALAGKGGVIIDRYVHPLEPGQAVLVQPHQLHHYADIQPPLRWLFVTFEQEPGTWQHFLNRRIALAIDQEALIARLIDGFLDPRPETAIRLGLTLRLLLDELNDRRLPAPTDQECAAVGGRLEVIEQVNRILYGRMDRPPSIGELAAEIGISPSHLRLLMRRCLGLSLGQYLLRVRLSQAQILLADPKVRIGAAARRCGFSSLQAFSRAMRRATGRSPREYRTKS